MNTRFRLSPPLGDPARRVSTNVWVIVSIVCVLLGLHMGRTATAGWGGDINSGAGPRLIDRVRTGLKNVLEAPEERRAEVIARFLDVHADPHVESIKRFRNPELKDLFVRMLAIDNWKVQHRALFSLEYYRDAALLEHVWPFLSHKEARLREKAAIACIKLWSKDAKAPPAPINALLRAESNLHVRSCLQALMARMKGSLLVDRVYEEVLVDLDGSLKITPFISGLPSAKSAAPNYKAKPQARSGGGSANKLPATARWTTPLLDYGREDVKGTSLQPFANLRGGGSTYHTGQDVGASLDGAGYYAPAEGIVKLIHTGSDMGTLIVVEHHLGNKELVNGVYMHGGDTVFVKAGDRVSCGQLLATMGMSYSIENGGHYSHLHYGMYPGPFSMTHNYGYKPVKAGLADWHDPAKFLPMWIERTAPLVAEFLAPEEPLEGIAKAMRHGHYGKALTELAKMETELGEKASKAQAAAMRTAIEGLPNAVKERAEGLRSRGYPNDALGLLTKSTVAGKGVPTIEQVADLASAWRKDKAFKTEVKAEKAFNKAMKSSAKQKDAAKRKKVWEKAMKACKGTPVEARVKEKL